MPISIFLRLGKLIAGFAFMISPLALALPPGLLDNNHPAVQAVIAVQKSVTDTWMQQPEVLGTAASANESGTAVLAVYVDRDAAKAGDVIRDLPQECPRDRRASASDGQVPFHARQPARWF